MHSCRLTFTLYLLTLCGLNLGYAVDIEEQAYVEVESVAWCLKPEHLEGRHWTIHRLPNCEYEKRHDVIRAICSIHTTKDWRTADDWTLIVTGPKVKDEDRQTTDQHYFFYLHKYNFNGEVQYSINWNADLKGNPVYSHAQWNLGEDYTYAKHPTMDIHTIEGHGFKMVLNFECSLLKYPEPESTKWDHYYQDAVSNFDMIIRTSELVELHAARIKALIQQKIKEIAEDGSNTPEYIDTLTQAVIQTQESWEAYATAQCAEVAISYGRGSGASLGSTMQYMELQVERIKALLPVYK